MVRACVISCFSRAQLCATLWTVAHKAPLSMGYDTLILSKIHLKKNRLGRSYSCCLVAELSPTVCNPMDCSPPDSSILGISQARILEWVAVSFSKKLQ